MSVPEFLDRLASVTPAPGGGAAAALAGASAAALVSMVCRVTARRAPSETLSAAESEADGLRRALWDMGERDSAAYARVIEAGRRPEAERAAAVAAAMRAATEVPLQMAAAGARVLELCDAITDEVRASALGDLAVAAVLASAALDAASLTARVNLKDIDDAAFVAAGEAALDAACRRATAARSRLGWQRGA